MSGYGQTNSKGIGPGLAELADWLGSEAVTVVPRAGASLDVALLERYCAEHLSKHKRPRRFEIVPELPKNFLGKIQRRRLRERGEAK